MPSDQIKDATWAKTTLREASLRATAARVAVLCRLAEVAQPQSHANMVDALQDTGFDQSTLFRCLNELADAGLVSRLDLGDQVRRFELIDPKEESSLGHAHFMCIDCGKLTCMDGFTLQVTPDRGPRRKALGEITEVLLRGHCQQCI